MSNANFDFSQFQLDTVTKSVSDADKKMVEAENAREIIYYQNRASGWVSAYLNSGGKLAEPKPLPPLMVKLTDTGERVSGPEYVCQPVATPPLPPPSPSESLAFKGSVDLTYQKLDNIQNMMIQIGMGIREILNRLPISTK